MKKLIIALFISFFSTILIAQDQTINGTLTLNEDLILRTNGLQTTPIGQYGSKIAFGPRIGADNGDPIWICRFNREVNRSDLRINIGDDSEGDDRFVVGNITWDAKDKFRDCFVVTNQARVGIGVSYPTCALDVNGAIRCKEVKIEVANWQAWPDFVFDKNYQLPTLEVVEQHINDKGHLPDIPSEKEVMENGVNVVEMQAKLLQKIEELTLYVIEQDKKIKEQDKKIEGLQSKLESKN